MIKRSLLYLNAKIDSIKVGDDVVTSNTTVREGNAKFTVNMPTSTSIAANSSVTMTVVAAFQNDTDITQSYGGETQRLRVEINTSQDDGNGGFVVTTPFTGTGTIYNRWSYTSLANSGSQAATTYSTSIEGLTEGSDYTTDASTLHKTYYLKHIVENYVIKESYVCFVSDTEHCMKGGDGGVSFAVNTGVIQDYQSYYGLGNYDESTRRGYSFNGSISECIDYDSSRLTAYSDGFTAESGIDAAFCLINAEGSSICDYPQI